MICSIHKVIIFLTLIISLPIYGQSQLEDFVRSARAQGYSDTEISELARSQGFNVLDLGMQGNFSDPEVNQRDINQRNRDTVGIGQAHLEKSKEEFEVFGKSFFKYGSQLSFQPNMSIPTPENYALGSGDELYVDIYGASEKYHNVKISPEGTITLANVGPIHVGGLTMEEARRTIFARLSRLYGGMSGPDPSTFLTVNLGTPKSIQVHIVGEVEVPGTYSLSGLSTAFNALYAASGPKATGSFRDVQVFRSNRKVGSIDLYDFLINGMSSQNLILQNGDVLLVKPYNNRVLIKGAIKRPGYYEMLDGEALDDLVTFAGGFAEGAFKEQVGIDRYTDSLRTVSTVYRSQFDIFTLKSGDAITVQTILDRYDNRISLKGAVNRPGYFPISKGMDLQDLISKAGGVRGDAVVDKILVRRTLPDFTTQSFTIRLGAGPFPLQPDDVIKIPSRFDLSEQPFVRITGEVFKEGTFLYTDNMTIVDILAMASGLKGSAQNGKIEIFRRLQDQTRKIQNEVISIPIGAGLDIGQNQDSLKLRPYDHVMVRRSPNYFGQRTVRIAGEVMFPGDFVLISDEDRISDLVERAGDLTEWADIEGAILIRRTEFFTGESDAENRVANLTAVQNDMEPMGSSSEALISNKIDEEIQRLRQQMELSEENIAAKAKRERLDLIKRRNPLIGDISIERSEPISIKLTEVLQKKGSKADLLLESGDILIIPKKQQTVRTRGRVLYPTTVRYFAPKNAKQYVNQSGGFDVRAKKNHTYVIYANGEVKRTRSLGFIRFYPKVLPGSEVVVPAKPIRIPIRPGEWVSIGTGLATIALVISQIQF